MILINFSHPVTEAHRTQIEVMVATAIARTVDVPTQFDEHRPFAPQLVEMLAATGLTSEEWQTEPILVVLPSLNFIAAALLADLHGRMGYFPPVVRTRPVAGSMPRRYEIAEILDLQTMREQARRKR